VALRSESFVVIDDGVGWEQMKIRFKV